MRTSALTLLLVTVALGCSTQNQSVPHKALLKHIELNLAAGVELFMPQNNPEKIGQVSQGIQFAGISHVKTPTDSKLRRLLDDLGYPCDELRSIYFFNPQGDAMAKAHDTVVEIPLVDEWRNVFTIRVAIGDTTQTLQEVFFKGRGLVIDTSQRSILPADGTMAKVNDVVFTYASGRWREVQ